MDHQPSASMTQTPLHPGERRRLQPLQSKNQPPAFLPHQPDPILSITSLTVRGKGTGLEGDTADCTSVQIFLIIHLMQIKCLAPSSPKPALKDPVLGPCGCHSHLFRKRTISRFFSEAARDPCNYFSDLCLPGCSRQSAQAFAGCTVLPSQLRAIEMSNPSTGSTIIS